MEKSLRKQLNNGRFHDVPIVRSLMMASIKSYGNKSTEQRFCQALEIANIRSWELHTKLVGNPDVVFPAYKLAIFLDGCFWHGCSTCGHVPNTNYDYWYTKIVRNIERDKQKNKDLQALGYSVLRFWEHELQHNLNQCVELTRDAIEESLIKLSSESHAP